MLKAKLAMFYFKRRRMLLIAGVVLGAAIAVYVFVIRK